MKNPTPLNNDGVSNSWDDDIPNIWKVIKFMFRTTNQMKFIKWNLAMDSMGFSRWKRWNDVMGLLGNLVGSCLDLYEKTMKHDG